MPIGQWFINLSRYRTQQVLCRPRHAPNQERIHKILVGGCSFELGRMLTKFIDVGRLDPEKDVNKPFQNISDVFRIIAREGAPKFHVF